MTAKVIPMPKKPTSPSDQTDSFVRPDWRDSSAYNWVASVSLRAIAWEFLRRNSDYCEAYSKYLDLSGCATFADEIMVAVWTDDAGGECLEIGVDDARLNHLAMENPGLKYQPLTVSMGAPWGLQNMVAPSTGYGGFEVQFIEDANRYWMLCTQYLTPDNSMAVQGTKGSPIVYFQVDLSLPLAVLDTVLKDAVRRQRQLAVKRGDVVPVTNRAVRKALYAQYLRILDGLHDGEKATEIGAVLDPEKANDSRIRERDKRYNAAAREAIRLMNGGYKVLPLLDTDRGKPVRKKQST